MHLVLTFSYLRLPDFAFITERLNVYQSLKTPVVDTVNNICPNTAFPYFPTIPQVKFRSKPGCCVIFNTPAIGTSALMPDDINPWKIDNQIKLILIWFLWSSPKVLEFVYSNTILQSISTSYMSMVKPFWVLFTGFSGITLWDRIYAIKFQDDVNFFTLWPCIHSFIYPKE